MSVLAAKPGAPAPKLEKRTQDSVVYTIDLTPLLMKNELAYGAVQYTAVAPLQISEVAAKQGKFISFRASHGPEDMPVQEYAVVFYVKTSFENILTVPVTVKVYSK